MFVWLVLPLLLGLAVGQDRGESALKNSTQRNEKRGDDKRGEIKKPLKDGGPEKKGARSLKVLGPLPAFTAEAEAAALKFVGENHEELASLLKQLKANSQLNANSAEEYRRAIRELFRTTEKLTQTKAADAERYELELEGWKIDSEIRLLAAKLTMGDAGELRGKLRQQLMRKNQLQVRRLELDKRRTEQRLKKIDENIERLKREQEQIAERQMSEILRTLRQDKPAKRRGAAVGVSDKDKRGEDRRGEDKRGEVEKVEPATAPDND